MEERLAKHLGNRIKELENAKKRGIKIIGYFPGSYVPEEIIYASGAIPLCLADGGDSYATEASLSVIPHHFCSFVRAQVGEIMLKRNPYYEVIDMLIAPVACQHLQKLAEIIEYYGDIETFKLGIPHQSDYDSDLEYYIDRLRVLAERLQELTGNNITNEKIVSAIELYNRIRGLLREISLTRYSSPVPITSLDFIKLNHASFYADPAFMVEVLESVHNEVSKKQQTARTNTPRLLLIGPNIVYGDYKVLELVNETGGEIVIEEVDEGVRNYWQSIDPKGDPIESLAKGYLRDRVPCAFMVHSAKTRLDFALNLIKDFNVSGVLWYELLGCETYDSEAYYFEKEMGERNIPMLILECDYGMVDVGQIKTRIEAFIETVGGIE